MPKENLATWLSTDEVKQAAALAQQYANAGYAPEALIARLGKIACRDNFSEMHALKHHQATYEEFHATRPSLRWRHLVAAVQAAAISHGRIQDVYEHAAEIMDVARGATRSPTPPPRGRRRGVPHPLRPRRGGRRLLGG